MDKITTHLWFDKDAKLAAEFYASVFPGGKVTSRSELHGTPSGDVDVLTVELPGQRFMLISAGPYFRFNPSVSFLVACESKEEVDALWQVLLVGGSALMELGKYPFSARYGWLSDRFGLSWQIMHVGERPIKQKITPTIMFVGDVCGKAEEAINFYVETFAGQAVSAASESKVGEIVRWQAGEEPNLAGTVKHAGFTLAGQEFAAMDSAYQHEFRFNEAISFMVYCDTQEEIDYFWGRLSADPEAEQCGWLRDKFGLSWQIVPTAMDEMMAKGDKEQVDRVTEAFLKMKKFDLAELQRAYDGRQ